MFPPRELENGMDFLVLALAGSLGAVASAWFAIRTRNAARQQLLRERSQFLAAAESSLDAFYIFDSVRDADGKIIDFTFRYMNAGGERRVKRSLASLQGKRLSEEAPLLLSPQLFATYCELVETGVPSRVEYPVADPALPTTWLRQHAVKLGDGFAVTSTDLTELKSIEAQCREIAQFSNSIFENAPFSIIATD